MGMKGAPNECQLPVFQSDKSQSCAPVFVNTLECFNHILNRHQNLNLKCSSIDVV